MLRLPRPTLLPPQQEPPPLLMEAALGRSRTLALTVELNLPPFCRFFLYFVLHLDLTLLLQCREWEPTLAVCPRRPSSSSNVVVVLSQQQQTPSGMTTMVPFLLCAYCDETSELSFLRPIVRNYSRFIASRTSKNYFLRLPGRGDQV